MNIAIVGPGRIGSTIASHLARAGHPVTLVARGSRLEALRRDGAIVSVDGTRAPVEVAATLDPAVPYDLVIATVMAAQVDAVLPQLIASAAKQVLFMFNTFEPIERLRDAVGPGRFAFGFPNMAAHFIDGRLKSVVNGPGMVTTLSSADLAAVFQKSGLPTEVESDMNSFLRSHAAFAVPLLIAGQLTWQRTTELTWAEARSLSLALLEALALVRALGHTLKPRMVAVMAKLPVFVLTAVIWAFSRSAPVKDTGAFGPDEVRSLIDAMAATAPGKTPRLLAIRP